MSNSRDSRTEISSSTTNTTDVAFGMENDLYSGPGASVKFAINPKLEDCGRCSTQSERGIKRSKKSCVTEWFEQESHGPSF